VFLSRQCLLPDVLLGVRRVINGGVQELDLRNELFCGFVFAFGSLIEALRDGVQLSQQRRRHPVRLLVLLWRLQVYFQSVDRNREDCILAEAENTTSVRMEYSYGCGWIQMEWMDGWIDERVTSEMS